VGKGVGEREEARVHRRRRIRPGKFAGLRTFDIKFRRFWRCFAREEKRRRGGDSGLFIAGSNLQEGLGFERWRDRTVQRAAVVGLDCVARKGELLTHGPGLSAAGGVPVRERKELGCGLSWWLCRIGAGQPASIYFFVLIPFLFLFFLFSFI
jgi:hypothetical protein